MKNRSRKNQNIHEAMDNVIQHFVFETDNQIELLWENNIIYSMIETKERLEAYLSYGKNETTPDVVQYLIDFGCSSSDIEKFFSLSRQSEETEKSAQNRGQSSREVILKYSLSDTLYLMKKVLHDSEEDPHYSAVTADRLFQDYLICKGMDEKYSVRGFLKTQGYSTTDIDLFYEKYRKECLHWYCGEPQTPKYANGILKVYEVENIFVVAILSEKENKVMTPKGAEFAADRLVKWTHNLELQNIPQPSAFLGKSMDELQTKFGVPLVFLTFGEHKDTPCYLTDQGHLIGFIFSNNTVSDFVEIDLIK